MPRPDNSINIRLATMDDYQAVKGLWQTAGLPIRPAGRESSEAWAVQIKRFPTTYLIAESGGEVVGVVLGTHDGRKGWINRLAVHPRLRGRGLGKRLLMACEAALAELGLEVFAALVEVDNQASAALFEHCGYRAQPVRYYRKTMREGV